MANDFLVFGGAGAANVITQATYAALAARTAGFSSGVAQSAQLNKVWRQSSIMAAVLAQFISDRTGQDVLDDGTTATILANLKLSAAAVNGDVTKTFSVAPATLSTHAMQLGQATGRLLNVRRITANGTYTPSAGTNSVLVYVQGGGGGGGSTSTTGAGQASIAGGGGSGGCGASYLTSGFSGVSMTVGGAGVGGGTNGGATSFGALITANGGSTAGNGPAFANTAAALALGGPGGSCSGGNIFNANGQDGYSGIFGQSSSFVSGAGAPSMFGGGGVGKPTASAVGASAVSNGAGGGGALAGASVAALVGGNGAAGVIVIYEYA